MADEKRKLHRIQFDISDSLYQRGEKYFHDDRFRHYFGAVAFEERVNRLEGRDKKLQAERMKSDIEYLQSLIDTGKIIIK